MLFHFTISSLQQLVDDIAEVLHFSSSRDGEWDIIYNVPTNRQVLVTNAKSRQTYLTGYCT